MSPSRIVETVLGCASFYLFGRDAPLSTMGWSLYENECRCREQFELLSEFTLDLLNDDWVRIGKRQLRVHNRNVRVLKAHV